MISWKSDIFLLNRRPYFWIALAGLVLYARSVRFDFTYLDDFIMVFNGLNAAGKPSGIFGIFFHNLYMSSEYYRPILSLSFIIDGKLWGLNPMGYHVTNVMLHILASCLVYKLFMGLGYDRKPAFAFSLLFIAHPLLSQAACWLPGRNDSLQIGRAHV